MMLQKQGYKGSLLTVKGGELWLEWILTKVHDYLGAGNDTSHWLIQVQAQMLNWAMPCDREGKKT